MKWTEEEVEYLLDNYEHTNNEKLGEALGRTAKAVCFKYTKLTGGRSGKHKYNKYEKGKVDIKKPTPKVKELTECPDCGSSKFNKVYRGYYFCQNCLREYNRYGKFIPPVE